MRHLHLCLIICLYFNNFTAREVKVKSHSVVSDSATPWIVVHGIPQARILEWVAFSFSRGSSQPRN